MSEGRHDSRVIFLKKRKKKKEKGKGRRETKIGEKKRRAGSLARRVMRRPRLIRN